MSKKTQVSGVAAGRRAVGRRSHGTADPDFRSQGATPSIPVADVTVLFVHGIGNQRPGSQVTKWGEACIQATRHIPASRRWESLSDTVSPIPVPGGAPMTGRDVVLRQAHSRKERTRRIRFAEANWSKDFQRPWLRTIGWLILCLPALLILLAYDTRDRDAFAGGPPATWRETLRVAWREALRELPSPFTGKVTTQDAMALRLTGRLFTALALVSAAIALLSHLPPWGIVASTTLAGVLLLNPRTNWANHVIVAMEGRAAYGQITARVQACLDTAAQHSQRIIVVAHSQGGFIAHELLVGARRPRQVTELIGLGSGLKPISLLRVFHKPRVLVGIWIGITGAALCVRLR